MGTYVNVRDLMYTADEYESICAFDGSEYF